MFVRLDRLPTGGKLSLFASEELGTRLRGTCFRGKDVACAGNFFRWSSMDRFLEDTVVLKEIRDSALQILESFDGNGSLTESFTFVYPTPVGWDGTDRMSRYSADELEAFSPSRRSQGFRVKIDVPRTAPMTRQVTVVADFQRQRKGGSHARIILLRSMYPGVDVGELHGDLSHREQRVFFDWNHPGAK